jgi:hypothetical protein
MFPVTMTRHVEKHMAPVTVADAMGVAPASRGLEDAAVEDIVTYDIDRQEYLLAVEQYATLLKGIRTTPN